MSRRRQKLAGKSANLGELALASLAASCAGTRGGELLDVLELLGSRDPATAAAVKLGANGRRLVNLASRSLVESRRAAPRDDDSREESVLAAMVIANAAEVDDALEDLVRGTDAVAVPQWETMKVLVEMVVAQETNNGAVKCAAGTRALKKFARDGPMKELGGVSESTAALLAVAGVSGLHAPVLKKKKIEEEIGQEEMKSFMSGMGKALEWFLNNVDDAGNVRPLRRLGDRWRFELLLRSMEGYSAVPGLAKFCFVGTGRHLEGLIIFCSGLLNTLLTGGSAGTEEGSIDESLLLSGLRVAANLTHECQAGCEVMQKKALEVACQMFVRCLESRENGKLGESQEAFLFDISLTLVGLLTNCVERTQQNRKIVGKYVGKIVNFFTSCLPHEVTERLKVGSIGKQIDFNWTAEELVTCSYVCLLMGCLMRDNDRNSERIHDLVPGKSLSILIQVLEAYIAFQKDADILSSEMLEKTAEVMQEIYQIAKRQGSVIPIVSSVPKRKTTMHPPSDLPLLPSNRNKNSATSSTTLPPVPLFGGDATILTNLPPVPLFGGDTEESETKKRRRDEGVPAPAEKKVAGPEIRNETQNTVVVAAKHSTYQTSAASTNRIRTGKKKRVEKKNGNEDSRAVLSLDEVM